ncbi:Pentatricopeptide repeat [Dillenia turbinata]|uniref:Pentatricopeptide repeat n=1 Tax=Dillenia turbinata TaxID=194707 RepID=A0AAN8W9W1_9MAGN
MHHPRSTVFIKGFMSSCAGTRARVAQSSCSLAEAIKGMVSKGLNEQALDLFQKEIHPSFVFHPNGMELASLLPSVIKACSGSSSIYYFGLQLHCLVLKSGFNSDPVVSNSLISMYAKFSDPPSARKLFDTMPCRDPISWNALLNCYLQNGCCAEALRVFKDMYANTSTFPKPQLIASLLSLSSKFGHLGLGKQIHAVLIADDRFERSVFITTALMDSYIRSHDLQAAFYIFNNQMVDKNVVSWTAIISGCASAQNSEMALHLFRAMQAEGIKPNRVTLLAILPVCTAEFAKEIHGYAFRHGFESESCFSSSLVHSYCKTGDVVAYHFAKIIFQRARDKDVIMWSSMIGSYSSRGDVAEALKLYGLMQLEGIRPNSITLLAMISSCTGSSSLSHGQGIHGYILKSGFSTDVFIGNSLIDMYGKCGFPLAAHRVFQEMPIRDCVSWCALINTYGLQGLGKEALRVYRGMLHDQGLEPDGITFLAVLSACNRAGLVEEGKTLFDEATTTHRIPLDTEHYSCYIDLLGRAGKLEDACEFVSSMPQRPNGTIWSSLVSACKLYGRLELAEKLAHRLIKLEPGSAANYALLSLVYAQSNNWHGVEEVRRKMSQGGIKKTYGFSQICSLNTSLCT